MDFILNILLESWRLLNQMSPYLLLGFLLAGILHVFVPSTLYSRYLSGRNMRSVVWAALFGIPLPLCSCGVIPTAMSLRREGASRGATVSFLIATPQTGVDSIIATYSLMGLPFAVVRPLVALVTALFGGVLVNLFDSEDEIVVGTRKPLTVSAQTVNSSSQNSQPFWAKLHAVLTYAFVEMMEDIGKWLIIGLIVAGFITAAVPDSWFAVFQGNSFYSILFVMALAIPMYLCATGSIPIAVALMMKGLTPGAALVLLMAGPASNAASILVVRKVLGRRTMLLYLASIIAGAVLFGLGIDYLLPSQWFTEELVMRAGCCHEHTSWFAIFCTCLMIFLLINALSPLRLWGSHHHHCHCHDDHCHCHDEDDGDCEAEPYNIYKVEGMHCNHCAANTRKALLSVEGVEDAQVTLETGEARLRGHYSEEAVRQAVEELGFSIEKQ